MTFSGRRALSLVLVVLCVASANNVAAQFTANYADALMKSILFFEGQRSGKLPANQRMHWRRDSALLDGHTIGLDLTGGYYDAGDNVKFGFPMAFTTTVLSWAVIEFGTNMGGEAGNAHGALRWATDYLLKATSQPNMVHVQVGDPYSDHACWERPEDMDTLRTVYTVDATKPGSEVAGETAAALAAASMAFKTSDPNYSGTLLNRAIQVFTFANKYRGSYANSLKGAVCPFYCDFSGYMDELIWAAAWLNLATNDVWYWNFVQSNIQQMESFNAGEFGWDDKHAGINVLVSRKLFGTDPSNAVIQKAYDFVCSVVPESPTKSVQYSPGGLMFKTGGSNIQHTSSISFLLIVFSRYLAAAGRTVQCGSVNVNPARLVQVAKSQADYILGNNPLGMSYMVGYGNKFAQRIHHRGSSLPSVAQHTTRLGCHDGTPYFQSQSPNPNLLIGAIVGGPDINDAFPDIRAFFNESEPVTYINAPMVGVFAYLNNMI